jgi:hypothetical protein
VQHLLTRKSQNSNNYLRLSSNRFLLIKSRLPLNFQAFAGLYLAVEVFTSRYLISSRFRCAFVKFTCTTKMAYASIVHVHKRRARTKRRLTPDMHQADPRSVRMMCWTLGLPASKRTELTDRCYNGTCAQSFNANASVISRNLVTHDHVIEICGRFSPVSVAF